MSYAELTSILKSQIVGVVAFETGIEHIFEPSLLKKNFYKNVRFIFRSVSYGLVVLKQ